MKRLLRLLVVAVTVLGLRAFANATTMVINDDLLFGPNSTTINFDTFPNGNTIPHEYLVGDTFIDAGVVFGSSDMTTSSEGFLKSAPNRLKGSKNGLDEITASFVTPVYLVGAYGFDFGISAYDLNNHLLISAIHTDGTAGIYGTKDEEFGFLGVLSTDPISKVVFSRAFPDQSSFGYEIDDLKFSATPVPEPSTMLLMGFGLIALVGFSRKLQYGN